MPLLTLFISTFLAIIFLSAIAYFASTLPFSPLFSRHGNHIALVRQLLHENKQRTIESKHFLGHFKNHGPTLYKRNESIDLLIVIIAMTPVKKSKEVGSITREVFQIQTLASTLKESNNSGTATFKSSAVTLCNVNVPPKANALAQRYSGLVDTFHRNSAYISDNTYEKEKEDYRFCLEQASFRYKPKYILVLEDDVTMKTGSLMTLSYLLSNILHYLQESTWVSIKLYHPKKWLGYGNDVPQILELVATAVFAGSLVRCFLQVCKFNLGAKILSQAFYQLFFVFIFLATCLILGRQNVFRWRSYFHFTHSLVKAQGCCTQAVLYNHAYIPKLLRYLSSVKSSESMPVDLALDEFADLYDLKQYMVEPNLCDHVGFLSTFEKDSHSAIDFLQWFSPNAWHNVLPRIQFKHSNPTLPFKSVIKHASTRYFELFILIDECNCD